jgi:ferredoxin
MKQESESARISSEKPSVSNAIGGDPDPGQYKYQSFDCETIDFHSPEFNRTDDLNDGSGNYRSFESLDGIITANERHQMERRRHGEGLNSPVDETVLATRVEVRHEEAEPAEAAGPLTVISTGRTLIIDMDAERAITCAKVLGERGLLCTLFITGRSSTSPSFDKPRRITLFEVDTVSITGAFGGFSATVVPRSDQKHLPGGVDDATAFDLVLDLQPTPSFAGDSLPIGYYAPAGSPTALDEAMAELPEMRGQFKKPQFISFLKSRCFHGRSRAHDCRRCLDVCSVGAIQSVGRKIVANHYLCQGCAGCALVCPADAIEVVQPSLEKLMHVMRKRLEDRGAVTDIPKTLVISDMELSGSARLPDAGLSGPGHGMHLEVEQIARVGLEVLLAALAYGVGEVLVACSPQNPPSIREAVESQVQMAHAILRGLGLPEEKIRFGVIPAEDIDSGRWAPGTPGPATQTGNPPMPPATFSPGQDKRTLVRLATQHLYDKCGTDQPSLHLPVASPFGAVSVDAATCTLCMACASACPSGALSAGGDTPRLVFRESQCHQCGLCGESCPEGAIRLLPRLLCDPGAVASQVVLHEAEPLRCIVCGVPFAAPAMINRIREKLTGHWMYNTERQLRRLQMCGTCRTRDTLTSQEMKSWNPK